MDFRILGPLEVLEGGRRLSLGGHKQRALLAVLVMNANEVVSSDRLIEALWDDEPPDRARKALQVLVSQLRKAIGKERLETRAPGYRLGLDPDELDLERFQRLMTEGRPEEALDLWRGHPLAEFAFERFAQAEIARLEELRVACLEERIDTDLAQGRHSDVVGELEALAHEHPLRERLRAQLMLALYRCGRQADALEAYREARRLLVEELGIEPSPQLQELQRAILSQAAWLLALPAKERVLGITPSLPAAANPLIGRRRELRAVSDQFLAGARLVTVTGAGGSGKTRLALEVATSLRADFGQQAYFVPLAPVRQAELLPATIMSTLGIREGAGEPPLETLTHSLQGQGLLLVLDNVEHLLDAAPALAELLANCPLLKLLVTSRAPLHVSGEHEYPLEPLPLKQAITLFTERARAVRPDFVGDEEMLAVVCARLDCLPLALELAAARSKLLSPQELLRRLEHRLELLTGGPRDLAERQQTLRATIEWSYELLDPDEQQLFACLGVFSGSCTLEAVECVCAGSIDQLESLVDKNLLTRRETEGEGRFLMLETIREYALERLGAAVGAEDIRRSHSDYFLGFAQLRVAELNQGQDAALGALDRELDNLRTAFAWAQEADPESALRLAAALSGFWYPRDQLAEGRRWLEAVLERPLAASRELALVMAELGRIDFFLGEIDAAAEWVDRALELAEALELPEVLSEAMNTNAILLEGAGRHQEALALFERALSIARDHDLAKALMRALYNLAYQLDNSDRQVEMRAIDLEGLELSRRLGNRVYEQRFLGHLQWGYVVLGDWEAALALAEEIDDASVPGRLDDSLGLLPWLHVQRGEVNEARRALMALRHLAASDDVQLRAVYGLNEASVLRAEGWPRQALAAAESVFSTRKLFGVGVALVKWGFVEAVEAAFALDDLERVAELLSEWERIPPADRTPSLEAHHARFSARLAARRGEGSDVEPGLVRATAFFRQLSMPFYVAVTLLERCEWLGTQARTDEAELLRTEANEIFERLRAKPWLERAAKASLQAGAAAVT
jgi:predicted ATPase/DNA-binding SARP family transcriptional activator